MSINAIGGMANSFGSVAGASAAPLSDATRMMLESLGINTSNIKTEAEGQQKLKEAQSAQANKTTQGQQNNPNSKVQMETLKDAVTSLAAQVGVSVSSKDKVADILDKIAVKIAELISQAGQDPQKLQAVKQYQESLASLTSEYSSMEAQKQGNQAKLSGSMDSLAAYNKIFHKL